MLYLLKVTHRYILHNAAIEVIRVNHKPIGARLIWVEVGAFYDVCIERETIEHSCSATWHLIFDHFEAPAV